MNEQALPDDTIAWVLAAHDGLEIVDSHVEALSGGTVAARIARIDVCVRARGGDRIVRLVRKWTWRHEVLGLKAAQSVQRRAPAIPLLIAYGHDNSGWWLITPFYEGAGVEARRIPTLVFESLAHLHARYANDWKELRGIPVIDADWWEELCLAYAMPMLDRQAATRPTASLQRARELLVNVARDKAVADVLIRLPKALLHGDVHPGNVIASTSGDGYLIDWGSARIGAPMLDLANVTTPETEHFAAYRRTWERLTGLTLNPYDVDLQYAWCALQIPIQYLPWQIENQSADAVKTALDRADQALEKLRARV